MCEGLLWKDEKLLLLHSGEKLELIRCDTEGRGTKLNQCSWDAVCSPWGIPNSMLIDPRGWAPLLCSPTLMCCWVLFGEFLLLCPLVADCTARAWMQWDLGMLFLHLHCKRNVKQQSDRSELYKGTLFSTIFLLVFRVAGEGFILLGAWCRGSVHTTSQRICRESWWLQPLTKSSFMTLGLVMGWMNTASEPVLWRAFKDNQ